MLIWAGLVFILSMLVFLPAIWISGFWPEPRRTSLLLNISRVWIAIFFLLSGIRLRIRGKEKFKTGQQYVVVCNHNSMLDVPITSPVVVSATAMSFGPDTSSVSRYRDVPPTPASWS